MTAGSILNRGFVLLLMLGAAFLASTGVAGAAEGAADNESTANAAKFMVLLVLALVLDGLVGKLWKHSVVIQKLLE